MRCERRREQILRCLRDGLKAASWLGRQVGACVRTIYRDIRVLRRQGFVIRSMPGRRGGFWLADTGQVRVTLDFGEVRQLVGALLSAHSRGGLLLRDAPRALADKLLEGFPTRRAQRFRALVGGPSGFDAAWRWPRLPAFAGPDETSILALEDALAERCRLHVVDVLDGYAQASVGIAAPLACEDDGWKLPLVVRQVAGRGVPQQERCVPLRKTTGMRARRRYEQGFFTVARWWGTNALRPPVRGPDVPVPIRVAVEPVLSSVGLATRFPEGWDWPGRR